MLYFHEMTFRTFQSHLSRFRYFLSLIYISVLSQIRLLDDVTGKADIVIIGGDLTEKNVPIERVKKNLNKLKSLGPVYFVWGNNDYETDFRKLDAIFLDSGVKVLDNTAVTFESETVINFVC